MTAELIAHLETVDEPLLVRRNGMLLWADQSLHAEAHLRDPRHYALLALVPGVRAWQRARILLQVLSASWVDVDADVRATLRRVVRVLVLGLPATHVATVLLALRHLRVNHKHVTRAAIQFMTGHSQVDGLLRTHRRVLVAIVEHALGKATARGTVRMIVESGAGGSDPERELRWRYLRFASHETVALARLRGLYSSVREDVPAVAIPEMPDLDLAGARPDTVTVTNRGDVAATLVHLCRGGPAARLEAALDGYVSAAAANVASHPGHLALVLDRSASMRG